MERRSEVIAGENPKGNKEIWESRERCRLLSLRNSELVLRPDLEYEINDRDLGHEQRER